MFYKKRKDLLNEKEFEEWRKISSYLPPDVLKETAFYKKHHYACTYVSPLRETYRYFESHCDTEVQKVLFFLTWINAPGTYGYNTPPLTEIYSKEDLEQAHQMALWFNSCTGL